MYVFKAGYAAQRAPAPKPAEVITRAASGAASLSKSDAAIAKRDAVIRKMYAKGARLKDIAAAVGYADERGVRVRLQRLGLFPKLPKRVPSKA